MRPDAKTSAQLRPTTIRYRGTTYRLISAGDLDEEVVPPSDSELDSILQDIKQKHTQKRKQEWRTVGPVPKAQRLPPIGAPETDPSEHSIHIQLTKQDFDFLDNLPSADPTFDVFMDRIVDKFDHPGRVSLWVSTEELRAVYYALVAAQHVTDPPTPKKQRDADIARSLRSFLEKNYGLLEQRTPSPSSSKSPQYRDVPQGPGNVRFFSYKGALYEKVADRDNLENDPYAPDAPKRTWLKSPETGKEPPTRGLPKYLRPRGKQRAEQQYQEVAKDVSEGDWTRLFSLIDDVVDPAIAKLPALLDDHNMKTLSQILDALNTINGILGRAVQDFTIKMKDGIINRRYPTQYGTPSLDQIFDDPERYREWLTKINEGLRAFMIHSPRMLAAAEVEAELLNVLGKQLTGRDIYTPEVLDTYRAEMKSAFGRLLNVNLAAGKEQVKQPVRERPVRTTGRVKKA